MERVYMSDCRCSPDRPRCDGSDCDDCDDCKCGKKNIDD